MSNRNNRNILLLPFLGSANPFIAALCYVIGCTLLIPSTVLFLPQYTTAHFDFAIKLLCGACALLVLAALLDFGRLVLTSYYRLCCGCCCSGEDPPDEGEASRLVSREDEEKPALQCHRESHEEEKKKSAAAGRINSLDDVITLLGGWMMIQGGALFEAGALLYLPSLTLCPIPGNDHLSCALLGTWVFRFGSISYLMGSAGSMWLTIQAARSRATENQATTPQTLREEGDAKEEEEEQRKRSSSSSVVVVLFRSSARVVCGILCYTFGAVLYIAGGALSEEKKPGFAQTWVAGSCLFCLGAWLFFWPSIVRIMSCSNP